MSDSKLKKLKKKKFYGPELILELFGCNLEIISSKDKIREFIDKICKVIRIKKYGPALIKRFMGGNLFEMGYSFFQFITTSSISGHFLEKERVAFVNIFSCSDFDTDKAASFAKKFFEAKRIKKKLINHFGY